MNILLDTHIVLWTLNDAPDLPQAARELITDVNNNIFYSTASTWEVMIKHLARPDKLKIDGGKMARGCRAMGFRMLPITDAHVEMLDTLVYHQDKGNEHKDPFDRILIAQAKAEDMFLITHDTKIPHYQEKCVISV